LVVSAIRPVFWSYSVMNVSFSRIVAALVGALVFSSSCFAAVDEVAKLLKTATEGSGKAQLKAIDRLGELRDNATVVVPALRKLIKSDDDMVQWHSARALGDYGELAKDAAPDVVKILRDNDPVVQYHAAIALGKLEDTSDATVSALVESATSKDPRVARAAISALRNLHPGPQKVAAALKDGLESNDQAVALHALECIVAEGGKASPLLKETLKEPKTAYLACTAIEQIGPDAASTVPELTELLGKTKHSQLLIQAMLAIASIGPKAQSAESAILPHLQSTTDKTVPVAAAYALGSIQAKDADSQLKAALAKNDPFLHMVTTWALARIHPNDQQMMKDAVDDLSKGLASSDAKMRTAAAKGLQILQPPPEMLGPVLLKVANDPDPDVSANIVSALAGLGESAVPRAMRALQNPKARSLALRVLAKIGPKAAEAVPSLIELSKSSDPQTQQQINFALASIGPAASSATDVLVSGISSDDKGIRESALYALRAVGPGAKAATRPLLQKMDADKSFDSMASAWALSRVAADNDKVVARVLPVLLRGLSSDDEQTRLNSAEAIGELGSHASKAAAELKKTAKEDKSEAVREAAKAAHKRVAG
jgi:HEAT repeat protein